MSSTPLYQELSNKQAEIRILSILSSQAFDDEIQCTINTELLLDATDFIALSYVWGDPTITREITVNGHKVAVTTNLADALQSLRKRVFVADQSWPETQANERSESTGSRRLTNRFWIDAICINQLDMDERSRQVRHMSQIYSNASRVYAWLGPVVPTTSLGIQVMRQLDSALQKSSDDPENLDWIDAPSHVESIRDQENARDTAWEAVKTLLNHDYWNRLWTWQERFLAHDLTVFAGDDELRITDTLMKAPQNISNSTNPEIWPTQRFGILLRGLIGDIASALWSRISMDLVPNSTTRATPSPLTAVHNGWHLESTDLRDKIYGAPGLDHASIQADYRKCVAQVYTDFARYTIEEEGPKCLCYAGVGCSEQRVEGLPSWVPDWQSKILWDKQPWLLNHENKLTGKGIAHVRDQYLVLQGVILPTRIKTVVCAHDLVGRIKYWQDLYDSYHPTGTFAAWLTLVLEVFMFDRRGFYPESGETDLLQDLVLVFHMLGVAREEDTLQHTLENMRKCSVGLAMTDLLLTISPPQDGEPVSESEQLIFRVIKLLTAALGDVFTHELLDWFQDLLRSAMFGCEDGTIGRAERDVRPRDLICFLEVFEKPFILRQEQPGADHILVSQCYLPDEVILRVREQIDHGTLTMQEIRIK